MSPRRDPFEILAEAATAMPWPVADIDEFLLHWCRSALSGTVTIEELPAPAPDLCVILADQRYLVARKRLGGGAFTEQDRRLLVALTTMATTSRHSASREARLERQSVTDALTGLWHHAYFRDKFEEVAEQRVNEKLGVLFLDLDRFKQINEELGHLDADQVLREVAARLLDALPTGTLVGRTGGDEFAAVLRDVRDQDQLDEVVARLSHAISAPMPVQDLMLTVDVSVGSTISHLATDDPDTLLRDAERAMRRNKRSRPGVKPPRWYDEHTALRDMLDQGLVAVAYQPIVDLRERTIKGYEALVRGQHQDLGAVSPVMLVDAASRLRLLDELTEVVVDHAITTLRRAVEITASPIMLSVNVEFEQLRRDSRLLDSLGARLEGSGVNLVLEVSERQVGRWTDEQVVTAEQLARAGIGLAVDDFGAGYSTLALLNSWEWTWVKLDRQLLSGDDDADRRVFGHVAHMLSDLDLTAVAEGIERPDQTERVLESGVTLGQGTLYSPPVTAQRVLGDLDRFGLRTSDSAE